jgi:Flp pilus assembly pilin Flp
MLKAFLLKFWRDDRGAFLNTAELIFLGTILAIGIIPGATALRDAIVTEFADMAAAVNPDPPTTDPVDPIDGPDGGQVATAAAFFN